MARLIPGPFRRGGPIDAQAARPLKAIFAAREGRYCGRRVTVAICQLGQKINYKTVQRLMVETGLQSLVWPKKRLARRFAADAAKQKWVTDVTEFIVAGGKLYHSPITDLFNSEIIAFETARRAAFFLGSSSDARGFFPQGGPYA
nr:IS3 family transposase [Rhizobium mesoamericanum]